MSEIKGLSIIIMLFCFNIGIFMVSASGLYDPGVDAYDVVTDLDAGTISNVNLVTILTGGMSALLGFITGAIAGRFMNADPLRVGGIGLVLGSLIPIWGNTYGVLSQFARTIQPSGGVFTWGVNIFLAFEVIMILIFIIQLTTGGWEGFK